MVRRETRGLNKVQDRRSLLKPKGLLEENRSMMFEFIEFRFLLFWGGCTTDG